LLNLCGRSSEEDKGNDSTGNDYTRLFSRFKTKNEKIKGESEEDGGEIGLPPDGNSKSYDEYKAELCFPGVIPQTS